MSNPTPIDGATIASKYASFNIINISYKTVKGHPIPASILVPKTISPAKHSIAIRWHGGGLITGSRLFADWYADWTLSLYSLTPTIAITPDYRLMPESSGQEILSDASDFYKWLLTPGQLASHLPSCISLDLSSLLISGESAGGWHALMAGFLIPKSISCIIAHYPMIDMRSEHFTKAYPKTILGQPPKEIHTDPSFLQGYVSKLSGEEVVTSRDVPDGEDLVMSMLQQGVYGKFFGSERDIYPLERLDSAETFPPTWILHGKKDSIVPIEGSEKFVEKLGRTLPDVPLLVTFQDGEEHGFDLHDAKSNAAATSETDWVKLGVDFVREYWPSSST